MGRRSLLSLLLVVLVGACAGSRPVETDAPTRGFERYPLNLTASEARRDRALVAWKRVSGQANGVETVSPNLQPVTSTVSALPAAPSLPALPRTSTGEGPETAEETREALRRFLVSASDLTGASVEMLSLLEVKEREGGAREALYEQRPFRYPLRNGYGVVSVTFTPDRRVRQLSSTAIPVDEQLQREVGELTPRFNADEAIRRLTERPVTWTDATTGAAQTFSLAPAESLAVRELVIYPAPGAADRLNLHLAWEVRSAGGASPRVIYLDAINGELLAVAPAGNSP